MKSQSLICTYLLLILCGAGSILALTTEDVGFSVETTPVDTTGRPIVGYYHTYDGTEDGEICVFMDVEMEFHFEYEGTDGTETHSVLIPDPTDFQFMKGNCTDSVQKIYMDVCGDWEVSFEYRVDMDDRYYCRIVDLFYYMRRQTPANQDDPCFFPNLPEDWDEEQRMQTLLDNHRHFETDRGYGYECNNGDAILYLVDVCGDEELKELHTTDQRSEAFSYNKTRDTFTYYELLPCRADMDIDYMVPIAIGAVSFGIAIIVVLIYTVQRCRRPHVYESSKEE